MSSADVLVLTQEKETAAAVRTVAESGSVKGNANVCKSMVELRTRLARLASSATRAIAVVDIDENPLQLLFELAKAIAANPGIRFIVVSKEFNEKLVLQAMQAGARHFLRKGSIPTELGTVIERLLLHEQQAPTRMGDVVSVFSCSGGCGATTATVNLANELRLATARPILIVDMDHHYGSVAHYLGIKGNYGIAHVLNREGAIDRHLIESSVIHVAEGLDVLLSPAAAEADAALPMNYDNLLKVLEACRESHGYVIVDAPRLPRPAVGDLASITRVAVVVFQLTVRDVAFARSVISFLTEQGMTADRIIPLANRVKRRGPLLKLEDSQRAIGIRPLYCVRSDWSKAIKSINRGQPLAEVAWRSGLRRDFRKIAEQVQRWTSNGHQEEEDTRV